MPEASAMSPNDNNAREKGKKTNTPNQVSYRVGYGQPPTDTRFKPGVSGNPKGRRKKVPSFSEVTEQVLNKTIELRMGDRLLRMSNREALVHSAIRQAYAGKPRLLTVLSTIMRYERESLQGQADADLTLTAEDEAILADFFVRQRATDNSGSGEENGIA
jgi:Family of unknown function (DUF5681)